MRFYTAELEITSLAADSGNNGNGLFIIEAASTPLIKIVSASMFNLSNNSHEMLNVGFFPITTKGALAGAVAAPTPRKHDQGDSDPTAVLYCADENGMGTEPTAWGEPLGRAGIANSSGFEYEPPFDARPKLNNGALAGLRLVTAPATAYDAVLLLTWSEEGG